MQWRQQNMTCSRRTNSDFRVVLELMHDFNDLLGEPDFISNQTYNTGFTKPLLITLLSKFNS
jgi:hypothetical protein